MNNEATTGPASKARSLAAVVAFMMVLGCSGILYALTITFSLDQWGADNPAYPYLWVQQIGTTNPNFAPSTEYAGLFSGHDTVNGTIYYLECIELNHSITFDTYTVNLYTNFMATPIQNGNPSDAGTLISEAQMKVLRGAFVSLGLGPCKINGLSVNGAQDLAGTTNGTVLLNLSNEQAAALQLTLWEVIHEPWQGISGISLDSGDLIWRQGDGSAFSPEFYQLFNTMVDGAFASSDVACPEPATFILLGMGLCGMAMLRKRTKNDGNGPGLK